MPTVETLAPYMQSADTLVACFVAINLAIVAVLYIVNHIRDGARREQGNR